MQCFIVVFYVIGWLTRYSDLKIGVRFLTKAVAFSRDLVWNIASHWYPGEADRICRNLVTYQEWLALYLHSSTRLYNKRA
jgi:hypothetical protein